MFAHSLVRTDKGLPWNGIGAFILLGSLLVNLISIPMNIRNHEELTQLSPGLSIKVPMSDIEINPALDAGPDPLGRLLYADDLQGARDLPSGNQSRHLSSSSSASTSSSTSGSGSGSHGSGHGSAHGGHHGHPHDTLIFLFGSFVIGAAVMQISAKWPILQQTVLLFIIGFVISLIIKGAKVEDDLGKFGTSYTMWMDIDPHLLLFTLLPALLAGDAMTIDTSVAKRVALQCLWLAGPGVVLGGFGTAGFLKLIFNDWDFKLCVCAGAMLCATDPVAVVALLKELGASPIITVQIQGESLLNDGTAIVMFLVAYDMMKGETYDVLEIAEFLIKVAMMAWALGLFIGYFFFSWIRAASDKLDHASGMIQITLTLCCAYWSFIFVEGVLGLSGVLATVASSLVLAHHMWPYVVSEESMHHVWHTFEALGNMIVFFLAGAKTGNIFLDIDAVDILWLLVIYVFLVLLRGSLIFGSLPILKQLSADKLPVTWQDATLMTWGGLRGAVGLAVALSVENGLAPHFQTGEPQIPQKQAQRILFFVAGIAFMTTLVNATTAPKLVQKLGITAMPQARVTLIKMFHEQLVGWSTNHGHPAEVTDALKHMLDEAYEHIAHQQLDKEGPASIRSGGKGVDHTQVQVLGPGTQRNLDLIAALAKAEAAWAEVPDTPLHRRLLGGELPPPGPDANGITLNLMGDSSIQDMITLIRDQWVDEGMAKVVNQIFLTMVYNNYWKLMEEGLLRPGGPEAEVLLTSVRVSLSPYRCDLEDFRYVYDKMICDADFKDQVEDGEGGLADPEMADAAKSGGLGAFVASANFNIVVALMILLCTLDIIAQEIWRNDAEKCKDHYNSIIWLLTNITFTGFFLGEMIIKMVALKCGYFGSNWNRFDFFLVIISIPGLIIALMNYGKDDEGDSGNLKILSVARVLRSMRFLRIFRLMHAKMSADKFVSMELARHMKKVTTLDCFVRAHVMAQCDLVKYFGGNGQLDEANETEIARCIMQSQCAAYTALCERANTQAQLGPDMYKELQNLHQRKHISEGLSKWIMKAHSDGALSATEAHAIVHPLNHLIAHTVQTLSDRAEGVIDVGGDKHGHGHGGGHGEGGGHGHGHGEAAEAKVVQVGGAPSSEPAPAPPDLLWADTFGASDAAPGAVVQPTTVGAAEAAPGAVEEAPAAVVEAPTASP